MAKKINKRNTIKVVFQNSFMKAYPTHNMEANAQKLLRIAMAQSKMNDNEFYEYEVSAVELATMFGVSKQDIYKCIDGWTKQCMGTIFEFRNDFSQEFHKYALFSKCEYKNGLLSMKINPDMSMFMLGIKKNLGFTQYELEPILHIKSKYTIRIYEMIMVELRNRLPYAGRQVICELSLDEIRKQTSTEKRYVKISDLRRNVIDKAIAEIEAIMNCTIICEYPKSSKSGRKYSTVRLTLKSKYYEQCYSKEEPNGSL